MVSFVIVKSEKFSKLLDSISKANVMLGCKLLINVSFSVRIVVFDFESSWQEFQLKGLVNLFPTFKTRSVLAREEAESFHSAVDFWF